MLFEGFFWEVKWPEKEEEELPILPVNITTMVYTKSHAQKKFMLG